jgi:CysZ protein
VIEVLLTLVTLLLSTVLVVALSSTLAAPFNDALSEQVERIVTGAEGQPFRLATVLRDAVRTVALEATKLAIYAGVMIPLFVLSLLVPVAGPALYSVVSFLFTSAYFAIDYIDWPATRRGRGVSERLSLLSKRSGPMFGFGAGVAVLLFVPVVNLLLMPAAVAGGTLFYLDLEGLRPPVKSP